MGFSIELDEDTARRLQEEATRRSVDASALGAAFVRERLPDLAPRSAKAREERVARFQRALVEIEEFGRKHPLPSLPDEALTREALYAEHD